MAGMLHGWIADSPQLACRRSGERYIRTDIAMACRVRSHPIRITYNYRNIPLIVVIYQLVAVQPCWVYYGIVFVFLVWAGVDGGTVGA